MNYSIFAGLVVGFAGSLHCVGMCGPLVLALPLGNDNLVKGVSLYHSGRILCYGFLGALLSLLGVTLRYSGFHELISISLGIFILVNLILFYCKVSVFKNTFGKTWLVQQMKFYWQQFFQTKSLLSLFIIGFLNGLLPCGFVYVALSFSLLFTNPFDTFIYMLCFGLGTVPALLSVNFFSKVLTANLRQKAQYFVPIGGLVVSVLLILRGLSLNIPYVSPVLDGIGCAACH